MKGFVEITEFSWFESRFTNKDLEALDDRFVPV